MVPPAQTRKVRDEPEQGRDTGLGISAGGTFRIIVEVAKIYKMNWFVVQVFAFYNKYFLFSD